MIVVADTTPLNYLVLIGHIDVLPALYQRVLIPYEVLRELQNPRTPPQVRAWVATIPAWCSVHTIVHAPDSTLDELDDGEREAIQLALESGVHTLLMDETAGRRKAVSLNLNVTGTVAVLEKAAQHGLVDFRSSLDLLQRSNFRLSASIRREFLKRNP